MAVNGIIGLSAIFMIYSIGLILECFATLSQKYQTMFDIGGLFLWSYAFLALSGWMLSIPLLLSFWLLVDPKLTLETIND